MLQSLQRFDVWSPRPPCLPTLNDCHIHVPPCSLRASAPVQPVGPPSWVSPERGPLPDGLLPALQARPCLLSRSQSKVTPRLSSPRGASGCDDPTLLLALGPQTWRWVGPTIILSTGSKQCLRPNLSFNVWLYQSPCLWILVISDSPLSGRALFPDRRQALPPRGAQDGKAPQQNLTSSALGCIRGSGTSG